MSEIKFNTLTEVEEVQTVLILYKEAKEFLENFSWCVSIRKCWYDDEHEICEKIGVFLFEIEPINDTIDDFIWVIVGDLPSVYLDKSITTGHEALDTYCELMQEWIDNVKSGRSLKECYPIPVEPSKENANLLDSRIKFIKQTLLKTGDK
jgi:hypothetical protein